MVWQELKRRLFTKYVIFSMIGILILTFGLNVTLIKDKSFFEESLKQESIYSGEMTEGKLWLGLEKVRDEKSDEIKYNPLISLISGLVKDYPGIMYFEDKVENYPDEYAKRFYECWEKKSIALIEKIPPKDQSKAIKELNNVQTPFMKYQGDYLWNLGIDNLKVVYMIIIFLVTFFAAATYSDSMEDGSMEIIYATKQGKKMMGIRLLPIIIYGLVLTLLATLSIVIILGSITGLETLKSSLKIFTLFSIKNFTLGGGILLMFTSELLGILALTTIIGYISYKTQNTTLTTAIGVAINIFYIIMNSFIKIPGKIFQYILNAFPMASSQIISEVSGFHFDMGIWRPYAIMFSMIWMFLIFGILIGFQVNSLSYSFKDLGREIVMHARKTNIF